MNRRELKAFCNLLMASDPSPLSLDQDTLLTAWANEEARRHGFPDWIAAFHDIRDEDPAAMFLVSWTGGLEPVQHAVRPTEPEAWTQAEDWAKDAKEGDDIDVFRIDLTTNAIERLERPKPEARVEPIWTVINDGVDRQYDDVPGSRGTSRWATIGPEGGGRWSWSIQATDDAGAQWEEDSGDADDEAAARTTIEAWRPKE